MTTCPRNHLFLAFFLASSTLATIPAAKAQSELSDRFECMIAQMSFMPIVDDLGTAAKTDNTTTVGQKVYGNAASPSAYWIAQSSSAVATLVSETSDPVLKRELQQLGDEIDKQKGHARFVSSPVLAHNLTQVYNWLQTHCPTTNKTSPTAQPSAMSGADMGPGLTSVTPAVRPGPIAKPIPVTREASDAPGMPLFSEINPANAAILLSAKGIQLVSTPTPADIQVIFDPNGPYGALLFKEMQAAYPFLPVRWVPVGVFGNNSIEKTATLLASTDPISALETDLQQFNNHAANGSGLIVNPQAPPLPAETQRLGKAMLVWGGFTPMVVFRDSQGRWLRTGGASLVVIKSILARAASQ